MTTIGDSSDDIFEAAARRHSKKKKMGVVERPSYPSDHMLKIDNFTTNFTSTGAAGSLGTAPPTGLPPPPVARPRTQLRVEAGGVGGGVWGAVHAGGGGGAERKNSHGRLAATNSLLSGYLPTTVSIQSNLDLPTLLYTYFCFTYCIILNVLLVLRTQIRYTYFKYVKQSTYIEFKYVKRSTYIEFEYIKRSTYIKFEYVKRVIFSFQF
jgi:hypothetical protein